MIINTDEPMVREALYCRSTGRRIPPQQGREPAQGSPVAVVVLDDGASISLFGDSVLGRRPSEDRRVATGDAKPIELIDPTRQLSRCHLLIRVRRWQIEVIDLGSSNGTSVRELDGGWTSLVPGIGRHVVDGQEVRLASRGLAIHHLRR